MNEFSFVPPSLGVDRATARKIHSAELTHTVLFDTLMCAMAVIRAEEETYYNEMV